MNDLTGKFILHNTYLNEKKYYVYIISNHILLLNIAIDIQKAVLYSLNVSFKKMSWKKNCFMYLKNRYSAFKISKYIF